MSFCPRFASMKATAEREPVNVSTRGVRHAYDRQHDDEGVHRRYRRRPRSFVPPCSSARCASSAIPTAVTGASHSDRRLGHQPGPGPNGNSLVPATAKRRAAIGRSAAAGSPFVSALRIRARRSRRSPSGSLGLCNTAREDDENLAEVRENTARGDRRIRVEVDETVLMLPPPTERLLAAYVVLMKPR